MSEIELFQNSDEAGPAKSEVSKLEYAPLTNLGCESEFAKLDVRIVVSGGSTTVQTHSRKNIVTTNRLLTDPSFSELGSTEKQQKWKWTRTSKNVAAVKAIEANYLQTVKMSKKLAVLKKVELKRKKTQRTVKLLDTCENHHGPVTQESILLVDTLVEKELISEIGYLRATVAPDINYTNAESEG